MKKDNLMKVISGNLIKLALAGEFDVIIQGCNCFNQMGKGFAKDIKEHFPEAYRADMCTTYGDKTKLGTYSFANIIRGNIKFTIVNLYSQFKYGLGGPHVDYDAIEIGFAKIKRQFQNNRIGYPLIGAGLAGGNWERISKIIDKELVDEDHSLVRLIY